MSLNQYLFFNPKYSPLLRLGGVCLSLLSFVFLVGLKTNAQGQTGTLSFNPTSFTASNSSEVSVSVVYTGSDITAGEIHINVPTDLTFTDFDEASGITSIINDPANGRIDWGKLDGGPVVSGTTLFTIKIRAKNCDKSGTLSFSSESRVDTGATLTFNTASFNTTCSGGGNVTTTLTTLPKTDINTSQILVLIVPVLMVLSGIVLVGILKKNKHNEIEVINLD